MFSGTKNLAAFAAGIAIAQAAPAAAAPMVRDLDSMKLAFASLVKGSYSSKSCSDIPDRAGTGLRPGTITISAAGGIVAERIRMSMFDPTASFALTKHYASKGGRGDHGFSYEVRVGGSMFRMSSNVTGEIGYADAGVDGGSGNVNDGMSCHSLDLSRAKVAPESYDLNEFLVPVFETGGEFVEGRCIGRGKHKETRMSRFRLDRAGVQIDDVSLAFDDARNPVVMSGIGSRFSDGMLNGDFRMKDGSGIHIERRFGEASKVVSFAYSVMDKGTKRELLCRVGR